MVLVLHVLLTRPTKWRELFTEKSITKYITVVSVTVTVSRHKLPVFWYSTEIQCHWFLHVLVEFLLSACTWIQGSISDKNKCLKEYRVLKAVVRLQLIIFLSFFDVF